MILRLNWSRKLYLLLMRTYMCKNGFQGINCLLMGSILPHFILL